MLFLNALVAVFSLVMLARHGPRAVLFLAPRAVRVRGEPDAPPRALGQVAGGERLAALGFTRLGLRRERGPAGGLDLELDGWARADGTCADVYPTAGRDVAVVFLTSLADGYQVATANFRRPAVTTAAGRVGGVAGATLDAALEVHRRAVEPLAAAHGAPRPVDALPARVELAHRFYAGVGGSEVRRAAVMSVVNAALALVLLASSVRQALRAFGVAL